MEDLHQLSKEQLINKVEELVSQNNIKLGTYQNIDAFKTLIKGTDEIIYLIDKDGNFLLSEGKGLKKLGLKPEQVVGQSAYDIYKDFPEIKESIIEALNGKTNTYIINIGGIYYKSWNSPIGDKDGEVSTILGMAVDITEQIEAEEKLRKSENLLANAIDKAAIGMCMVNMDGSFIKANKSFCEMLGYNNSELIKLKFEEIVHPDELETDEIVFQPLVDNKKGTVNFERRYIRKNGDVLIATITSTILFDETNEKYFYFSQILDITDKKLAENKLVESSAKWQTTFNAMKNSVSIIDTDCFIQQYNKATKEMLNIDDEMIKSKRCHEFFHDSNSPIQECPLNKMKKSLKSESTVYHMDGKWYQVNIDPIFDTEKNLTGGVHVVYEITDLKESRERIARFSKIFEDSLNEIFIFESDNLKLTEVNASALKNLGYTIDEMRLKTPYDIKPEISKEEFHKLIQPLIDGSESNLIFETKHERKNGTTYDVEVHLQLLQYEETSMFAAIILDISDKKKAALALKESEIKFQRMLQQIPIPVVYVNNKGEFIFRNKRFMEVVGYGEDEVPDINAWWLKAYPDEEYRESIKEIWAVAIDDAAKSGGHITGDVFKVCCGDGKTRQLMITGITLGDELLTTLIDMTNQKEAEKEVIKQMKIQQDILEGTNAGTWNWNIQTGETTLNARWAEIMGYTLDELKPISIETFKKNIHPDDAEMVNEQLQKNFNRELDYYDVIYRQPHKNGNWVWIHARGKVIKWDKNNKPIRMSGTHLDITDRQVAEQELSKYRDQLEILVTERTKELEEKNKELDKALKVFVGREQTIRELQKKIRHLKGGSN